MNTHKLSISKKTIVEFSGKNYNAVVTAISCNALVTAISC
jgi:hypothetical protein